MHRVLLLFVAVWLAVLHAPGAAPQASAQTPAGSATAGPIDESWPPQPPSPGTGPGGNLSLAQRNAPGPAPSPSPLFDERLPPANFSAPGDGSMIENDSWAMPPGSTAPPGPVLGPGAIVVPPTLWSLQADSLWLQRNIGTNNFLGGTYHHFNTVEQLASGDENFSFQPGLRLQLTRRINDVMSLQVVYFGMQNWVSGRTIYADPANHTYAFSPYTQTDALIGGFYTSLGYTNGSRLQNVEFNQTFERGQAGNWRWRTLWGFRYFQWNDHINLEGLDNLYPAYENVTLKSDNYLLGGQVGAQFERDWNRLHWLLSGKVGLFGNLIHLYESNLNSSGYLYGTPAGFQPYTATATRGGTAGVLDFSTMLTYHLLPNFQLRAGYNLLFIPGLVLAPNQMDGTIHQGSILLHGPSAGFEITW